ncbi:MAG: alpha/beta fold hydrolase [Nocardioidaceae bacterium]|nr:alpha/beta fold hydrolase [Nocardioidaceae bacterium]
MVSERIGQFFHDGCRLEFTEYGGTRDGVNRWVILLHGQLIPRRMHQPLARAMAGAGYHVVTLDLLGHGRSDRPDDPLVYSTTAFAEQVVHLMDELGIEDAVVGGTSLGANVSLEVAVLAPERVRGLLLEMPFLDNAVNAGLVAFVPLMFTARYLPFTVDLVRRSTRLVPRGVVPFWAGIVLDTLAQQPGAMAAALHGMIFGRIAPPAKVRETLEMPALVIGHPHDPIHPAADAAMLADELPTSEFVEADSFLEWRLRPARLDAKAIEFLDGVFAGSGSGTKTGQVPRRTRNIRST